MTDLTMHIAPTPLERRDARTAAADTLLGLPISMPLVLDLDGTLIKGDLLYKSFFSILRRNPLIVLACARWLLRGRAVLKRQLALRNRIDWDRLEFHQEVVALAHREQAAGRMIVLATAADAVLAGQLAFRLPFFDQILASDGARNLKGPAKAALLRQLFPDGFIYAGDSKSDLAVWADASGIVLVTTRRSVRDAALALGRPVLDLSSPPDSQR
ncbi:haloacid dehalogenase-like hydrolase [Bradyrhizobium sp. USDA 10063]